MSILFEKAMPSNVEVERSVLGAVLLDDGLFVTTAASLTPDDFSLEKHRRIFARMTELQARGEPIDRITVANELMKHGELESCDGLSYIVSLDDHLPMTLNIDGYVRIVKEKSILRRIIFAGQHMMNRALMGEEDPQTILAGAQEGLLRLGNSDTRTCIATPSQVLEGYPGGMNAFLNPSEAPRGLSTGFLKLDEKTNGLQNGDLVVLAGRPSMGKTALALNIASHAAWQSHRKIAIFSLEMSKEAIATRLVTTSARVNQHKYRAGYLSADDRKRLNDATQHFLVSGIRLDDQAAMVLDIHSKCRRMKAAEGLDLVIIDYLQLIQSPGKNPNRNQEISEMSRSLKLMAKDLEAPIIVLSQLSRACEVRQGDHRPQLSDLRDSGSIEQDADVVMFVYREEVYNRDREDLKGAAELILAKQRNGPVGKIELLFLHELIKFENRVQDSAGVE